MHRPDPHATRAHWNALADDYDAAKDRNVVYYGCLTALLLDRVPITHRRRVLDVGCGTGRILAALDAAEGIGIDSSERMVDRARAAYAERADLRFEVGDAGDLQPWGKFDAVISADLLEHVPDWRAVVDSVAKVTTAGGTIVLTTPSPAWTFPLFVLEKLKLKMPEGPHQFVWRRAIADRLAAVGCRVTGCSTHLLLPADLAGLGPKISARVETWPLFRHLGVIQIIEAVKLDDRDNEETS